MKRILLIAFALLLTAGIFAQSPYKGVPWNGVPWEFKAEPANDHNFSPDGRIILWKYDVGPAINPAPEETGNQPSGAGDFSVEGNDNLEWVIGMRDGRWRVRDDDETRRLDSAEFLGIELDASDISLMDGENGWSNFNWDPVQNRPRDGGIWPRYTVNFEKGLYRFINRGFPNINGNFNIYLKLRDTATMAIVLETPSFNNLKDLGNLTIDLGMDPGTETGPRYAALPNTELETQHWYAYNEVWELEGPYIVEFTLHGSGASGGQSSEITFENLPENTVANLTLTSAGDIDGCDGSTTITAAADGDAGLPGVAVEYKFSLGGYTLQDWGEDADIDVYWPGTYKVASRLVGYVVEQTTTVDVVKLGCAPTAYMDMAQAIPGKLQFELFDGGGVGVAYQEVSSPFKNDKDWMARNDEERGLMGADIDSTTADTIALDNTINNEINKSFGPVDEMGDGEWYIYSMSVAEDADYSIEFLYNSDGTNTSKTVWVEVWEDDLSACVDSFEIPATGNWDIWEGIYGNRDSVPDTLTVFDYKWYDTIVEQTFPLMAGDYKFRASPGTNNMNLDYLSFTKVDPVTPELSVVQTPVMQTVPLKVEGKDTINVKSMMAYLVPQGTAADAASIKAAAVSMQSLWVNKSLTSSCNFETTEVAAGLYTVYGIDKLDQVSAGVDVEILGLEKPTLTLSANRVFPATPVDVTMSVDGVIGIFNAGTHPDSIVWDSAWNFKVNEKLDTLAAGVPFTLSTIGYPVQKYLIYGKSIDPVTMNILTDSAQMELATNIGVEEETTAKISVYPTLVENTMFVYTSTPSSDIEIFSIVGVRMKHITDHGGGGIDLSDLDNGIYLVRVSAGQDQTTLRIIKR